MGLKAKPYTDDINFENYEIINKRTLNYFDAIKNSNKYYTVELHKCNNICRVFTDYGRLGVTSTKQVRETDCFELAEKEFNSILNSKIKKGYREIELAQSTTGSEKAKELVDVSAIKPKSPRSSKKSSLHPDIQEFVRQIFDEAGKKLNQFVRGNVDSKGASPLGKLSKRQISKGRSLLQDISNIITINSSVTIDDVINLSNEYYSNIPKSFGSRVNPSDIAIRTLDEIAEQMDILKFYEDSLRMGDIIYDVSNIDKQYKSLKSKIEILPNTDKMYKKLEDYVRNSESHHHGVQLEVRRIFTIKQNNAPEFDDSVGNKRLLFHGTRTANMPGILSSYLKLPTQLKGVHITGAMFGPGIYFADNSTKSSQYSCSRFGGTANRYDTAFMFVSEVALGKVYEVEDSHYFLKPPKGYSSVKGVAGNSLLHNEYIIYKENQHELKYIIEFKPRRKR